MGLFNRATVAQPQGNHSFVECIQNEGENTGRGFIAWRHPSTDFSTNSKLLVRTGEEAIFENGACEWAVFPERTECELKTQNIAIIRAFREALSGGQSMFPCRVYFISTKEFEVEWGTIDPVQYLCPLFGDYVEMRGGGLYQIKVIDSAKFAAELLRDNLSYTKEDLAQKLQSFIYQRIADIIANVLEENKIASMHFTKKKREIGELCKPEIQKVLDKYGILLLDFSVELALDEEFRQQYVDSVAKGMEARGEAKARMISAQSKLEELQTLGGAYTTIKGMDLLETLAENPGAGGVASAGAGIGMGIAAGGAFGNLAQTVFSGGQTQQPQQPQTQNFGGANRFGVGQAAQPQQPDPMESLKKMKQMLEAGLISQEIYDAKVAEILSRM